MNYLEPLRFPVRENLQLDHMNPNNCNGKMRTSTGQLFDILNPTAAMINIHDIARGLAYKAHFSGQTRQYFSIAQHCMLVCEFIPLNLREDRKFVLLALLHDAAEAYIGDMIKPLKVHLPLFISIENKIMEAICAHFELDYSRMGEIKQYDLSAQQMEYNNFYMGESSLEFLDPEPALYKFIIMFDRIANQQLIQ